jgi:protein tyrosine phosphatase (PTP) superfamily phosphohydrolase (DUF442 family)/cytochrome c556
MLDCFQRRVQQVAALACVAAVLAVGAVRLRASETLPDGPLPIAATAPIDFAGLHHVIRLSEKLYSGGVPEGDSGFQALQRLGVKTIITVDGAQPEVERARKLGMRYVHLPFGYDGCPTPQANAIAKAVRDLPGPVYLHCHHGKHRSPTAAAFARIALDGVSNEQAVQELQRAGTGKNYTGLYGDVRRYAPPTIQELDRLNVAFPEVAPTQPLVAAMVEGEQRFDRLMKLQKDGWKANAGVDAAYEALQLQELFTELNRTGDIKQRPEDYRRWMRESERDGKALEAALRAGKTEAAGMFLGKVAAGCGSCHAKYRNVPQRRK